MSVDRTKSPLVVPCRRQPFPGMFGCHGHADCRAEFWRRFDAAVLHAELRGVPVPPKSRKKVA